MESLTVPGSRDSLPRVAQWVVAAATEAGLSSKAAYRLRLAVDEIAANIVSHGYGDRQRAGSLDLEARIDPQRLTIYLEDTGQAFDPTEHSAPRNLDRPLEERAPGGLGIHLARTSVDCFRYERVGNRNRSVFEMNRVG
ncbi:MAG: ATP-binding protein [Candidatus Latescibacterota bacterium]